MSKQRTGRRRKGDGGSCSFRNPKSAIRNGRDRRGILLLVVLSLLVLFLLVGTAYITSSNQYRRANKSLGAPDEPAKNPLQHTDLLEEVVNQLVRDTTNHNSSLRYHSLLRDMYGGDGIEIGPTSPDDIRFVDRNNFEYINSSGDPVETSLLDQQLVNLTGSQFFWAAVELNRVNPQLSTQSNYYNGRVFTLMDGPAAGRSARVVRYDYRVGTVGFDYGVFFLTLIDSDRHFTSAELNIQQSHLAVLNGQPFNGTGVGYNPNFAGGGPQLSGLERVVLSTGTTPNYSIALMPNAAMFDPNNVDHFGSSAFGWSRITPGYFDPVTDPNSLLYNPVAVRDYVGRGGADESYDAVDFQNMALALSPVSPIETLMPDLGAVVPPALYNRNAPPPLLGNVVLPSFHRPALINYWQSQLLPASVGAPRYEASLLRKVMLRPNWIDHPKFTGSNPEYAEAIAPANLLTNTVDPLLRMIYGPWDVDNDFDGRRDSVWVDFGAPVMMGPQGRLVKPLAAILCLDMDGRLNLNAHGTHHLAGFPEFAGPPNDEPLAGGTFSSNVAEGQGYGPAEIDLEPVLGIYFERILRGVRANNQHDLDPNGNEFVRPWSGRYGSQREVLFSLFGRSQPGVHDSYDLLAQLKQQGVPQRANFNATLQQRLGNYATPPDFFGRYPVALNALGQPVYEVTSHAVDLDMDSPYELDLSPVGASSAGDQAKDGPFSLGEMERILRAFDADAGKLPPRLWELANQFRTSSSSGFADVEELNEWRALLTTDSFDLPVPNVVLPQWMRLGANGVPDNDPNDPSNDDFAAVMGRYDAINNVHYPRAPTNLSIADLIEYRTRIGLAASTGLLSSGRLPRNVDRGELNAVLQQLIAPELSDGLRLDLNRPFGNGRDDNNNGVVDEPGEYFDANNNGVFDPGEVEAPYWWVDGTRAGVNGIGDPNNFTDPISGSFRDAFDRNGNGTIQNFEWGDSNGDNSLSQQELVALHNFRRQLFARHLYVLAMTLVDPVAPLPAPPPAWTSQQIKAHKLKLSERAERLAQWAINVVDYRDADSIMTAFEYDTNPFNGWQVDGDLTTTNDPTNYSDDRIDNNSNGSIDQADIKEVANDDGIDNDGDTLTDSDDPDEIAERRTVWGLERPELVMTETLSWHDRATEDRGSGFEDAITDENFDKKMDSNDEGSVGSQSSTSNDMDYDQRKRPQGATFVEFYCPWQGDTAPSADTHDINYSDPNGPDQGVNLSAFVIDDNNRRSPVWRVKVHKSSSAFLFGGGPDRDPDHQSIWGQPLNPDRTVYFTDFDPEADFLMPSSVLGKQQSTWDDDGAAFFRSPTSVAIPAPIVRPGKYLVFGSGDEDSLVPGKYEATIGDRMPGSTDASRAIVLEPNNAGRRVWLRHDKDMFGMPSQTGEPVRDQDGFQVSADSSLTSAYVVDSYHWRRYKTINKERIIEDDREILGNARFSVSEPAMGYPDHVFNSVWQPGTSPTQARYEPIMDIPLDNQRVVKEPGLTGGVAFDVIDGQQVIGATDVKWYRSTDPLNPPHPLKMQEIPKDDEARLKLSPKGSTVRTIPGFSWMYLQRLANPLTPWNPLPVRHDGSVHPAHNPLFPVNPYLTIDSMGTNVTVFTGQATEEKRRQGGTVENYNNADSMYSFSSVQRGRLNNADPLALAARTGETQDAIRDMNINSAMTGKFIGSPQSNAGDPKANLWTDERIGRLTGTALPLGLWLNLAGPMGDGLLNEVAARTHFFNSVPDCTLGFLNEPFRDTGVAEKRTPLSPYPWMAWNNRPFANGGELLQVPIFRSSQVSKTFSMLKPTGTNHKNLPRGDAIEQYEGPVRRGSYPIKQGFIQLSPEIVVDGPFGHLLNFFRSKMYDDPGLNGNVGDSDDITSQGIAGLSRVLDFVGVPSRYVGTETWLNPLAFGNSNVTATDDPRYLRQPPFNKVAAYREPGRVNLNTIVDHRVWDGGMLDRELFNPNSPWNPNTNIYDLNSGHIGPPSIEADTLNFQPDFVYGRRGYVRDTTTLGASDSVLLLYDNMPTFFANPYRSPSAGKHVPIQLMIRTDVDCTTLRRVPIDRGADTQWGVAGVDDDGNGTIDDLSEAGIGYTQGTDNRWGVAGVDDDGNGTLDDVSEQGFGDDQLNDDVQVPLFASTLAGNGEEYHDAARNAYFRYQLLSRLSQMTTTRSNVYAVWITVGFFEVDEADRARFNTIHPIVPGIFDIGDQAALFARVYPEGYELGQEMGSETGELERLREFAIIDRTIPVAFEPGKDHNVERAVRLRRRIE